MLPCFIFLWKNNKYLLIQKKLITVATSISKGTDMREWQQLSWFSFMHWCLAALYITADSPVKAKDAEGRDTKPVLAVDYLLSLGYQRYCRT